MRGSSCSTVPPSLTLVLSDHEEEEEASFDDSIVWQENRILESAIGLDVCREGTRTGAGALESGSSDGREVGIRTRRGGYTALLSGVTIHGT